jgi:transaldolase / glucose-6-phosphate isomerase
MTVLHNIHQLGQSIWFDNISRGMIRKGELQQMVVQGLLGVTSNPSIFEKSITTSDDYDDQIRDLVKENPDIDSGDIIQELMIEDIRNACDVLKTVYDKTGGADGFVSIEVTPRKAHDTQATVEEVRYLWDRINRPNLMVKIPATDEGVPAIEEMIYEGKNINVTLIFSVDRYKQVADAYISGIERRVKGGEPVDHIASVASVFVSRIDTLVDSLLEEKIREAFEDVEKEQYKNLMGVAAVANIKLVYQAYQEKFTHPRFIRLTERTARVQRPLWGSTSTKNPAYDDLKYVETLIGPDTVNTVPPNTYEAILEKAKPKETIEQDVEKSGEHIEELQKAGIDMDWVMKKLENDGVAAFEKSFDGLYEKLEEKKREFSSSASR